MISSHQPPRLRAHITSQGVLRVTGLPEHPAGLTADHVEPSNAYSELLNITQDLAITVGGQVWLHAGTADGDWTFAVHPDGVTVPVPHEAFLATDNLPADPTLPLPDGSITATEDLPADPTGLTDVPTGVTPIHPATVEVDRAGSVDEISELVGALATAGAMQPIPAAEVLALAADPNVRIRAAATAELATWGDDPAVVTDSTLAPDQLGELADNRLAWIRAGVAGHPSTSVDTLECLARDADPQVVQAVAARVDLPAHLLTELCTHPDPMVRAELGRNPQAAFLIHTPAPRHAAVDPANPPAGGGSAGTGDGEPSRDADADRGSLLTRTPVTLSPERPASPPLELSAPLHTTRRRPHRLILVAAAVGLVLSGGVVWHATTAGSAAGPGASTSVAWHGTWLPTGPDGPSDPTAAVVSGFAHTPAGAALAAAHLGLRIDAYAGPASFEHTITEQTYGGDPHALLASTEKAYHQAAKAAGVTDGAALPTSAGQIHGWRIDDWVDSGPVRVHLLVATPSGGWLDYAIAVAWVDGDFDLVDPTRADTFVISPDPDPSTYQRF